jgi:cobalt/nickel transport system permease protein
MVHISDGILSLPVLAAGWAITVALIGVALWWSKKKGNLEEEIPKLSVMTAAFFVASLVHIPVGPTSAHLILNGLVGVILGIFAFPAIFVGITLQALLFQHGGIITIGVNTANMGIAALIAFGIFRGGSKLGFLSERIELKKRIKVIRIGILGALILGLAVVLGVFLISAIRIITGKEFFDIATIVAVILTVISFIAALLRASEARNRIFCAIFAGLVVVTVIFSIFCYFEVVAKNIDFFWIAITLAYANIPVTLVVAAVIGFDIAYLVRAYSDARIGIFSAFVGGLAVLLAVIFTAFALIATSEERFLDIAIVLTLAHIPIMLFEALVTGSIVVFLMRVKPELIGGLGDDE